MADDIWEVALPSGEVKRMTLDQLDRAFQVGLIHSDTLIREHGEQEWQSLGAVAGLEDEAEEIEPETEPSSARASVLPAPAGTDQSLGRETLAGLGGFLAVAPHGTSPFPPTQAPAPIQPSQPPALPNNAFGTPQPTAPAPRAAPATPAARQPAPQRAGPPPLPSGAFAPGPAPAASQSVPPLGSKPPPPPPARSAPPGATALSRSVQPAPAGHARRGPPPLPASAFPSTAPVVSASDVVPGVNALAAGGSRAAERATNGFVIGLTVLTLFWTLHRNDLLFKAAAKLGAEKAYAGFEMAVLGKPGVDTPRGVELVFPARPAAASAAPGGSVLPGATTAPASTTSAP